MAVVIGGIFTYHSGWIYFTKGPTKEKQDEGLSLLRTGLVEQAKQGEKLDKLTAPAEVTRPSIPEFLPYVNGVPITDACYVTIPVTNDSKALDFKVKNIGKGPANGLQMIVNFPTNVIVTASPETWMPTTPFNEGSNEKVGPGYYSIFHEIIGQGDELVFKDPITLQASNLSGTMNTLVIKVSSASSMAPLRNTLFIHFTNGVGQPRLGF